MGLLSMKPSGYWERQCFGGASFMPKDEVDMRHAIGVDKLMWGSDYPHIEGTWPFTREKLQGAFEGVPEDETRLMVGENAVRCYNFDRQALASAAERVGPRPGDL